MGFETKDFHCFHHSYHRFEHTLWDLKPCQEQASLPLGACLNIPYGIWNVKSLREKDKATKCLNIPYGIWNLTKCTAAVTQLKFEHTLWDLKPMFLLIKGCIKIVWTYPMGFETLRFNKIVIDNIACLNIPYGIWNKFLRGTLRSF